MLIKGHELNQQSRQEFRNAHTVFNSDMIARGKVKMTAMKSILYMSDIHAAPAWPQGAVKAWDHRYRLAPDSITFEPHLGIDPAISVSAMLKGCIELAMHTYGGLSAHFTSRKIKW